MSAVTEPATHDHGDGHHAHHPFHAHHFETMEQQFDSGKLGIWLFLITEVMFFSGLFCAYAIYRSYHPEIFVAGHHFLDKTLGAANTIVLLFSSLTMAWAVRCAQLGQKNGLVICLVLTLACAGTFMVVKYFEYSHKIHLGLVPARYFSYVPGSEEHGHDGEHGAAAHDAEHGGAAEHSDAHATTHNPAATPDTLDSTTAAQESALLVHDPVEKAAIEGKDELPRRIGIFFSIYYCLTGLHGIHIIAGMIAIGWILRRSIRGDFGPQYFGPVDYVGLYWHLVDLIWVFLFPLLYLIQ